MATTVGEVRVGLKFDTKEAQEETKKLGKEAERSGNEIAKKLGDGAKAAGKAIAAGLAVGTVAMGALAKAAVDAYADYEQLAGGIDTLFKDSSATMKAYADQAYMTAGLSANAYMETATSFSASLLQGLGNDTAKAAEYANQAIIDMSDNANKMGTDMQRIQDAYQGFAKQNFTMLDNLKLGYGGTKEEMQRLLDDAEKLTGTKFDISNFGDITQAIHAIQTEMGITGTTSAEAADTISGSLNSTKAAWENVLASFGSGNDEAIGKAIDGLIDSAGNVVKNITRILPNVVNGIVSLVNALIPQLPTIMQQILPPLITGATMLITALANALPQVITPENINMIVTAGVNIFMALLQALPQVLAALSAALPQVIDTILAFLTDPNTIALLLEAAITLFFALVAAVPQILGSLMQAFANLVGTLWQGIVKMFSDFAGKFGETIGNIFKGAINGVISFIEGFINAPLNVVNGFIDVINGAFGVVGVNIGKIPAFTLPRLAEGAAVAGATTAIIGEAGDEVVLPLERNTGNWSGLLANALADEMETIGVGGGDITVYMTNEINNEMDADDIGRKLMQSIRRSANA